MSPLAKYVLSGAISGILLILYLFLGGICAFFPSVVNIFAGYNLLPPEEVPNLTAFAVGHACMLSAVLALEWHETARAEMGEETIYAIERATKGWLLGHWWQIGLTATSTTAVLILLL